MRNVMTGTVDPMTLRATADALVGRVADQLRDQLKQVAALIDPFPPFPGAMFAYGFEIDPPFGGDPERGCIILGDDGALYELRIGLDPAQLGADASAERQEELIPVDLPAPVYVAYAHRAMEVATDYLEGLPRKV